MIALIMPHSIRDWGFGLKICIFILSTYLQAFVKNPTVAFSCGCTLKCEFLCEFPDPTWRLTHDH